MLKHDSLIEADTLLSRVLHIMDEYGLDIAAGHASHSQEMLRQELALLARVRRSHDPAEAVRLSLRSNDACHIVESRE